MALLDHFNPPLSVSRHWQGLHSAWANSMVAGLNARLPARYFAEPNVQHGGWVEIDVATFEEEPRTRREGRATATAIWSPSSATQVLPMDFAGLDEFEVRIYNDQEGPHPVAAIELLSPANKDRPSHRRAFVTKCAALLQQGVSVAVIDVVTTRRDCLHGDLLSLLGSEAGAPASGLIAVEYRVVTSEASASLETWVEPLELGDPLPTLPLWIAADLALPLDLDESYRSACSLLRIPNP